MKYTVKFLSEDKVCTIYPALVVEEARRIVKDLNSMRLSAWIEKEENYTINNEENVS